LGSHAALASDYRGRIAARRTGSPQPDRARGNFHSGDPAGTPGFPPAGTSRRTRDGRWRRPAGSACFPSSARPTRLTSEPARRGFLNMFRLFLTGLLALFACAAHAQVGFSPQYFDLRLAEAQPTNAYRLFNLTRDPKQVRVSVVSWTLDEQGEIRLLPSTDTSLDQWVVVNPIEFTIAPGDSQAVRFSIRPAVELPPGEHRAMLVFDEVLLPQTPEAAASNGAQTALRARFQFRTAIYCQVGAVERSAELTSVKVDAGEMHLQVRATGSANARFDGQYMVWKQSTFPGLDKVALLSGLNDEKPLLPA